MFILGSFYLYDLADWKVSEKRPETKEKVRTFDKMNRSRLRSGASAAE